MEAEFFKFLGASGDMAMIVAAMIFWKFDKRLTRLEWMVEKWSKNPDK